jgi:hypothetical protein
LGGEGTSPAKLLSSPLPPYAFICEH